MTVWLWQCPKWEGRAEHMGAAFSSGGIPGSPRSSAHGNELPTAGVGGHVCQVGVSHCLGNLVFLDVL